MKGDSKEKSSSGEYLDRESICKILEQEGFGSIQGIEMSFFWLVVYDLEGGQF